MFILELIMTVACMRDVYVYQHNILSLLSLIKIAKWSFPNQHTIPIRSKVGSKIYTPSCIQ